MAKLRVDAGKSQGKTVDLDRPTVIGRGETAQLQINDLKASREHCKVFEQAGSWMVADLNSRNGIKVNGVTTTRKTLASGDRIEIGETVIVFDGAGAPAAAAAQAKPSAPAAAPEQPAPAAKAAAPKTESAASKKAAAMAEARAAASAKPAAAKPAAAGATATKAAPRAGQAKPEGKGLEVSDRVLQFHKVDPRKATVMDVDLTQSPGTTKFLIFLGCVAFLGVLVWLFSTLVE